jgi:hypothetical protein
MSVSQLRCATSLMTLLAGRWRLQGLQLHEDSGLALCWCCCESEMGRALHSVAPRAPIRGSVLCTAGTVSGRRSARRSLVR